MVADTRYPVICLIYEARTKTRSFPCMSPDLKLEHKRVGPMTENPR